MNINAAAEIPQPDDPWGEAGRIAQSAERKSHSPLRRRCVVAKVTLTSSSNLWYCTPSYIITKHLHTHTHTHITALFMSSLIPLVCNIEKLGMGLGPGTRVHCVDLICCNKRFMTL